MSDLALARSIDAAGRLLARQAELLWRHEPAVHWPEPLAAPPLDRRLLGYLLGRGGRPVPALPDTGQTLTLEVMALLGAGDDAGAVAFTLAHQSEMWATEVSQFGATTAVDCLVDEAIATGALLGCDSRMLARTRQPEALFELMGRHGWDMETGFIGELVIRGRDAGRPHDLAEARWAALATPPWYFEAPRSVPFQDAVVRLAARGDMQHALDLLDVWEGPGVRTGFRDGPEAVIARLVRTDAERAVALVSTRPTQRRRIAWAHHMLRWDVMPAAAVSFFDALLARGNDQIDLALAGSLATLDDPGWLERAWPGVTRKRPLAIAATFARPLRRLRDRGQPERAEALRDRLAPVLAAGAPERPFAPLDLLDAFSAPGLPPGTPFGLDLP